jgi:CRP-like cAMP-binding protein
MIVIMLDDILLLMPSLTRRDFAYEVGEAVFHLGDPVKLIHFVTAGVIHLVRHQQHGAALVLQRAGEGSILAEPSMFSDAYHCDARVITAARTVAVSRDEVLDRVKGDGAFALAWSRRLAHEVQKARLQAEIVSIKTVAARLDAWLNWYGSMPTKGSWVSLAAEIGVSPEALYREISKRRGSQRPYL